MGPLLQEMEWLHGAICWEASRIAAGWETNLLQKLWGTTEKLGVLSISCTGRRFGLAGGAAVRRCSGWSEPSPSCSNLPSVGAAKVFRAGCLLRTSSRCELGSRHALERRQRKQTLTLPSWLLQADGSSVWVVGLTTTSSARIPPWGITLQIHGTSQIAVHCCPRRQ